MKVLKWLIATHFIIILFFSCGNIENDQTSDSSKEDSAAISMDVNEIMISDSQKNEITDILQSLSPPIELNYLLNEIDLKFNSSILADKYEQEKYLSSTEKSQILGILSTDLVYCLVYGRSDLTKKYIQEIEVVATDLQLNDVIDFERLNRYTEESINTEELAMQFTSEMEKVIRHLETSGQIQLSAVISYSGWIESLYIASHVGKQSGTFDEELIDLVYYETIMSKSYRVMFKILKDYPGFSKMFKEADELANLYSQIEVDLKKAETVVTYKDSVASAVSVSTQKLNLKEGQFDEIVRNIQQIRNNLVK